MKFSKNFERDYNWYFKYRFKFDFCGSLNPNHTPIPDENGKTAKEALFSIDTYGKNIGCREPELLNELLLCKASINFMIKMWAETRAEGTLPLIMFSKREAFKRYEVPLTDEPDIHEEFELIDWMIEAVEKQKYKFYKKST
jgi:hypothetical protein